ncbi:MAG: hypothetical protein JW784_04130 [Candidatus Cloacimonetes bacterium]|nr:hypothetical protein [Candidatus Cloacimonadota bacterium]
MKMKIYFVIAILAWEAVLLQGFNPSPQDFNSPYQFLLFRSWLEKADFSPEAPAAFSPDRIRLSFSNDTGLNVLAEHDWVNYRINNQRENLSRLADQLPPELLKDLETILYRINTADSCFFYDLIRSAGITVRYGTGNEDLLWLEWSDKRLEPENFELVEILEIPWPAVIIGIGEKKIQLEFNEGNIDYTALSSLEAARRIEFSKQAFSEQITPTIYISSLSKFLESNWQNPPTRELLHNKVPDPDSFIRREFPDHYIEKSLNTYTLQADPWQQELWRDMVIIVEDESDGLNIKPGLEYRLDNNVFRLPSGEEIDLDGLTSDEIAGISPYLPQLLYFHRALGTKLLNFLLVHDNVPSTLILYTEQRQKYEFDSYADLLLLLNSFWRTREIFFSLQDFRKMNNFIEFRGILIARDKQSNLKDHAEIWFHLDLDYRLDLIMMILFPDQS